MPGNMMTPQLYNPIPAPGQAVLAPSVAIVATSIALGSCDGFRQFFKRL
jgi:hypothetical protein